MTANRDLKRRVRDRQAHTGESYMTALQRVLAQRPGSIPSAIPTVEFVDLTELAESLNLKCQVVASPALVRIIDVKPTLERFREMLVVTRHDPALALVRSVALRGEHIQFEVTHASANEGVAFIRRLQAGLGGVSANGRILALRAVPRPMPHGAPPASGGSPPVALDELGQVIDVLYTGHANRGSQPVALDEPMALFSIWLTPSFVTKTRPPMLIATSLDEIVNDPLIDLVRELRGQKVQP
jgi:hypothetical protein